MNITPIQDCLIVRPDVEKHELFVLLRDKKLGSGVVLSKGSLATQVEIGDHIQFGEFVGQELRWQGEDLLVMREQHVTGVFEDE